MKYFLIYNDTKFTIIEELDTIEELKKRISEINKDKKLHLIQTILGKELKNVA